MAVVYNYFEPIPIQDTENPKFESRICKTCSKPKRIEKGKTSNLITHLQSTSHLAVYEKYLEEVKELEKKAFSVNSRKRKSMSAPSSPAPSNSVSKWASVVRLPSQVKNTSWYKQNYDNLVRMLVKTMIPISIVENQDFKEWLFAMNNFQPPTRNTIKNTALPRMRSELKEKIREIFKK